MPRNSFKNLYCKYLKNPLTFNLKISKITKHKLDSDIASFKHMISLNSLYIRFYQIYFVSRPTQS